MHRELGPIELSTLKFFNRIAGIQRSIAQSGNSLRKASDTELRQRAEDLRYELQIVLASGKHERESPLKIAGLALAKEVVQRQIGIELYDTQLHAAFAMLNGEVAEMATGEGKTLAVATAALVRGVAGRGAHVATPNEYLAQRDYAATKPLFECLGLNLGLRPKDSLQSSKQVSEAYSGDATYGTGHGFGFDYLKTKVHSIEEERRPLGTRLIRRMHQAGESLASQIRHRQFRSCLVDEADHLLIDDALTPLVLAGESDGPAEDRPAIELAHQLAMEMSPAVHFAVGSHHVELTQAGQELAFSSDLKIPFRLLRRAWNSYLETALTANLLLHRDLHYVVRDQRVQIVDATTGRIYEQRNWQAGLQQAIEWKEGLEPRAEPASLAEITKQGFFRAYESLAGTSGTAQDCRAELQRVYHMKTSRIPLRLPSLRIDHPLRTYASAEQKFEAISRSIFEMHTTRRPVLVGTSSITQSHHLSDMLQKLGVSHQLLTGVQDASEAEVVSQAGQVGCVTIATNLAGRGTDIKLSATARELGGLHVILSECSDNARVDRQLRGRCARQGDPGSSQAFLSAEDDLLRNHATWLSEAIRRMSSGGELTMDLSAKVRRYQRLAERKRFANRLRLLQQSQESAVARPRSVGV